MSLHLLHMCHQHHGHHHHPHHYDTTTTTTTKTTISSLVYPPNAHTDTPHPPSNPPPSPTGVEGHFSGSLNLEDEVAALPVEVVNFLKQFTERPTAKETATGKGRSKKRPLESE